jgi:hypothetical protein
MGYGKQALQDALAMKRDDVFLFRYIRVAVMPVRPWAQSEEVVQRSTAK